MVAPASREGQTGVDVAGVGLGPAGPGKQTGVVPGGGLDGDRAAACVDGQRLADRDRSGARDRPADILAVGRVAHLARDQVRGAGHGQPTEFDMAALGLHALQVAGLDGVRPGDAPASAALAHGGRDMGGPLGGERAGDLDVAAACTEQCPADNARGGAADLDPAALVSLGIPGFGGVDAQSAGLNIKRGQLDVAARRGDIVTSSAGQLQRGGHIAGVGLGPVHPRA